MTTLTLHGVDGSVWNLLDRSSPVHLLDGMGGLHLAPATNRWARTARRSGRRWKDVATDSREFTMNLRVGDADPPYRLGDEWRALDGQFWKALAYDRSARLVVNGERSLTFRLDDDNDHVYPKDPALYGKAVYSVACIADRPEWQADTVTATYSFAQTTPTNYYGSGEGPPFVISTPDVARTATITNVGDMPAYPLWRITGPATTAVVGIGDRLIQIPFSRQAGQQIVIDTEAQTITDGAGVSLWPLMGYTPVDFAPIPPGGRMPIAIGLEDGADSSQIQVTVTPLFRRAWG